MAGASARAEYERRRAKDEQRLRQQWGPLGRVAVALTPERNSTAAWARGAIGEERLGARLDGLRGDHVAVLHDRHIPRSRANVDHLVVTRSAVWVIDAKRYKGQPQRVVTGGLLRPREEHLVVGRRNCDKLVAGVRKQVCLVQSAVPFAPVRGVLCFIEADWPLFTSGFRIGDMLVLTPRRLSKRIRESTQGSLDVHLVSSSLAATFRR